ncbi:helix-turn-helix domain-containing protein [Jeotgalibacillus aurantiacus]|uniref:helix-turn-helix domain-containing protein n=1 Tax=Jeotgalibacillus aurantiacus TaxID=2763266 RepID=UPI001D0A3B90|nr:helix-turn-helix transcriptional regulator [Jeotgalibacillus aurantiacus]
MIGENIYKIRREKGMTLSELAERSGVSKSYLSNIERNLKQNPSIQVIEKIAKVLEVDVKRLLNMPSSSKENKEWTEFIQELKDHGVDKNQLKEYRMILEYIKWKNEQRNGTES